MSQLAPLTQSPPQGIQPQIDWCISWIYQLRGRIGSSGGGGSNPSLTSTYIGVGSPSNTLTGYSEFNYDPLTFQFNVGINSARLIEASTNDVNTKIAVSFGDTAFIANRTSVNIQDQSSVVDVTGLQDGLGRFGRMAAFNGQTKLIKFGDVDRILNTTLLTIDNVSNVIISTNSIASPTMSINTAGGDVEMSNSTRGMYYDPPIVVTSATISFPSSPVDGQEVIIYFGGQILTTLPVISNLTLQPNIGQSLIGISPGPVNSSNKIEAKYRGDTTTWYSNFIAS